MGFIIGGTGTGAVMSSLTATPAIGAEYGGGYYAGSISATGNGVATHYLIIAPKSTGEASYAWTTGSTSRTSIVSEIDGYANTVALAALSASNYPAFAWARALTIGGYTDWYIPAKNELNTMYYNLAPVSSSATGGFTANANAVYPQPTSSWTTGNPSQTTATAFRSGGAEQFSESFPPYWSSTDGTTDWGDNAAWRMSGWSGGWNVSGKYDVNKVRAIRKVAINTPAAGTGMIISSYVAASGNKAIFGYGSGPTAITNLVSNAGVVATDTTGVGTARYYLAGAGYGNDKAIFGYGWSSGGGFMSMTNLVSNAGVVATDTAGVGTARRLLAAAGYGTDKAIFGYGTTTTNVSGLVSVTNKVSNTGVVATDTSGVGTARMMPAAAGYGTDKAIFGYGMDSGAAYLSTTNKVSNTGVVATDTSGVGTARGGLAAATYGTDKAIFGYGNGGAITNLVSNTGVVATDTSGVGTGRTQLAAATYGTDKAIFGYGEGPSGDVSITNLVSNTGVVATDTTGVGTARYGLAAAAYGS